MWTAVIYAIGWILVGAAAGILYLSNSFTFATTIILGFSASVLAGAALLVVYPALLTEKLMQTAEDARKSKRKSFVTGKLQSSG